MAGSSESTALSRKKFRRRAGLVPYLGWNPRQFSKGEWKFLDMPFYNVSTVFDWYTYSLIQLLPGTGASQRIGTKIAVKTIELRVAWSSYPVPGTPANGVDQNQRLVIALDRQANGAMPGGTNYATMQAILTDYGTYGVGDISLRNLANRKRFKILLDKTHWIAAPSKDTTAKTAHYFLKFRKPLIVEYNAGVVGDVTDIVSNNIIMGVYSTASSVATGGRFDATVRIRYTDN